MKNNLRGNLVITQRTLQFVWNASRQTMTAILIITFLLGIIVPVNTIVWSRFLDALANIHSDDHLSKVILWLALNCGLWVLNGMLQKINKYYKDMQSDYVNLYITNKVLDKINSLEIIHFDDPNVYDQINKVNSEALSRSISILNNLVSIIQNGVILLGVIGIIILYKPAMIALLLLTFIPILIINIKISSKLHNIYNSRLENLRLVTAIKSLMIRYDNIKELKITQMGNELLLRVSNTYKKYLAEDKKIRRRNTTIQTFGDSVELLTKFFFTLYIIIDCIKRKFSVGNIVMYITSIDNLMQAIGNIIVTFANTYNDNLYMRTLFDFLDKEIPASEHERTVSLNHFKSIKLQHVFFKYPKLDKYVLEDINLEIEAGKSYLIVGLNGSGKTTLIKILSGLYEPSSGEISVDGVDVLTYDKNSYRNNFAVVFQDFIHYPMDVADNIKFGRYADKDNNSKMYRAAQQSGAIEFINKLPDAYETQLQNEWSEGTEISVGQWQKLAITRAFFSDAPITIMDEPTASLDPIAENEFYLGIEEMIKSRTCIMISHRFTTAKLVDKIIVIDNHRISECGSFEELISREGKFKELFTLQAEKYNLGDVVYEA
ncbi:ABC transporter ATP-binding protein [Paenibacillus sonchi]|uniref:ABC transporter ATP-binding protein n=1 Tax=Paenibacillus sonchi TaxID=373687 RepID=UPI001E435296|nr:ABC transporter ATP-binding protein [Paenibacillus sonchi]MCE3202820.1 ABC transporter ATP-binding protein/permease [Paenibacillus sonchi]